MYLGLDNNRAERTGRGPKRSPPRHLRVWPLRYGAASAAGIAKIGNHTFRATGITAYLKNGGRLGNAAAMANLASTRTTQSCTTGDT
jgi:integrase